MDPLEVLNAKALATGLGAAVAVLIAGFGLEALPLKPAVAKVLRPAVLPLALAAGLFAAYALNYGVPWGKTRPWYQGDLLQMVTLATGVVGILVLRLRESPAWLGWAMWGALAVAAVMLVVRGPWVASEDRPAWEAWWWLAAFGAGMLVLYRVALEPVVREPRLWLLGLLVPWLCASATGIAVLPVLDMRVGRLFVYIAVMAGVAVVAAIFKKRREEAWRASLLLAGVFSMALTAGAFYDRVEWPLPLGALLGLAAGPLASAVAWIPPLRKRPLVALGVALMVGLLACVPALVVAGRVMREME